MQFIRQNATHKVVVGPFVDVGDGFTPETGITLSGADEAEVILHDGTTVVSISGYTWAAITTMDGYYNLTLQSGISGTVGHMIVVVQDDSVCLPVVARFTVVEEAVYDALYAAAAPGFSTVAAVASIPTTAMRGTDSAALASVATESRLAELDAANLPTDIAAIPTTAMRGTDSAALASVATEARLAELDAANLPTDIAAIPTTMVGTDNAATSAKQDTMETSLGTVTKVGPTKTEMDAAHTLLATPAQVLTQINAALDAAIAELAVAAPTATPTIRTGIMLMYMALRNRLDVQTSATDAIEIRNDAGTIIAKKLITDDGSDYSEAKAVSG